MEHALTCKKCDDTGWWQYDSTHAQVCPDCCAHSSRWHYPDPADNCHHLHNVCADGCGTRLDPSVPAFKESKKPRKSPFTDGRPRLQKDWEGWIVESLVPLSNTSFSFPIGSRFLVWSVSNAGITLKLIHTCRHCRLIERAWISRVKKDTVKFIKKATEEEKNEFWLKDI